MEFGHRIVGAIGEPVRCSRCGRKITNGVYVENVEGCLMAFGSTCYERYFSETVTDAEFEAHGREVVNRLDDIFRRHFER